MSGREVRCVLLVKDGAASAEVAAPIVHESGSAVDRVATVADALVHIRGAHPPAVVPLPLASPEAGETVSLWPCGHYDVLASVPGLALTAWPHQELDDDLVPDITLEKPFESDGPCAVADCRFQTAGPPVGAAFARLWSDHDR